MSCFVHHMIRKGIFYEMDIPASEEDAEELEAIIVDIVGMKGQECPEIWKKVSCWLDKPNLRETLRKRIVGQSSSPPLQTTSVVRP